MDDRVILEHLFNLEAEAAALVDDAQAEADRRIAEGEKQNRVLFDEVYSREAAALEAGCVQKIAAVKEDYLKQLEALRESLKTMPLDREAFSSLAEKILLPADPAFRES